MQLAPYGTWSSVFSADLITSDVVAYGALSSTPGYLFWLETRPGESGRCVLVSLAEAADALPTELTPAPYNVRTRVHEYGGGAYLATHDSVYFVNFADQDLYRVSHPGGEIVQITNTGPRRTLCGLRAGRAAAAVAVRVRAPRFRRSGELDRGHRSAHR